MAGWAIFASSASRILDFAGRVESGFSVGLGRPQRVLRSQRRDIYSRVREDLLSEARHETVWLSESSAARWSQTRLAKILFKQIYSGILHRTL